MYILLIAAILCWDSASCKSGHDDGEQSDCTESSWLCSQLALMRHQIAKKNQINEQYTSLIAQQSGVIAQQRTYIAQLQNLVTKPDISPRNAQQELAIPTHDINILATDKLNDSKAGEQALMSRADELIPLETVVNQMGQQLAALTADIQATKNANQDGRASTFVHWGSSQCPGESQRVYSGVMGGSLYSQPGGGTNYLCLTMSPVFDTHSNPGRYAILYGSEYKTFTDSHHDFDAVCSVCRASHATTIMIPGTNVCTPGWTKQYDGYLMAEQDVHNAAQYICVDSQMESRPGSNLSQDGRLLYFTMTRCGSLPCGPYENNKIVTCVVCSR